VWRRYMALLDETAAAGGPMFAQGHSRGLNVPAGARRLVQKAAGIAATVVNGEGLLRDGRHTGALPGRLLRGPLARA
jgi:N-acyl-D-aspartate/D-glutamate deacylase